ncbi:MAG: hypothetical protein AMXMBFR47_03480 [Planctomycetota bacterium]
MRRISTLAVAALAVFALSGCAKKFTRENFNLITVGVDDRMDVQQRIGPPRSTFGDSDQWFYEDEDDHYSALIHFDEGSGKVSGKQWMDGMTGEFSGNNPHLNPPPEGETRETRTKTRTID